MAEKRNIVLITLDSLRADHCSFIGYHRETTPTMDKMAKKGLYFEIAVPSGLNTRPSMFGVHTGNYLISSSSDNFRDIRKLMLIEFSRCKTIAQALSDRGYYTMAFNPNPWASSFYGFNKGFKVFNDFLNVNRSKSEIFIKFLKKVFREESFINNLIVNFVSMTKHWEKIYDYIKKYVNNINYPYFIWIFILDTHLPYVPPPNCRIFSKKNTMQLYYLNWKVRKFATDCMKLEKYKNDIINAYDDCIRYADEFIKRLWEDLKDDDPIFIIHGDHGEGFGEHGYYYHPFPILYEEFTRVPLVIYNADVKGKVDYPVSLRQIPATIMKLIGERNEFPSKSMLEEENNYVICKVFDRGRRKIAVRLKNWKFITGQKEEDELYNLKKDPYEQENVIDEHPDLVKELRKIVQSHIKQESVIRKIRESVKSLRIR